jgi:hypothetical protein
MIWNSRIKIHSMATSASGLKWVLPRYAAWMRSLPYVRGEKYTRICPTDGIDSIGIKTPEMKMSGSRTMFSMDMISPGLSVGYAANRVPIVAKQNAVRIIPRKRGRTSRMGVPKMSRPAIKGTNAIPILYKNPLRLSPNTTACREMGADTRRSKVFIRRSIGMETGSMDEAEKRIVIAISPGIITEGAAGFPTAKARNMNRGKSAPETMILGLR